MPQRKQRKVIRVTDEILKSLLPQSKLVNVESDTGTVRLPDKPGLKVKPPKEETTSPVLTEVGGHKLLLDKKKGIAKPFQIPQSTWEALVEQRINERRKRAESSEEELQKAREKEQKQLAKIPFEVWQENGQWFWINDYNEVESISKEVAQRLLRAEELEEESGKYLRGRTEKLRERLGVSKKKKPQAGHLELGQFIRESIKATKTATNPQTGEMAYFINNQWLVPRNGRWVQAQ